MSAARATPPGDATGALALEDDAAALVRWAVATFGDGLRVATSLGPEDLVVLDLLARAVEATGAAAPRVFFLDTGRMHEATFRFFDKVVDRYGPIEVVAPEPALVRDLLRRQGAYGMRASLEARRACCDVRKVDGLARALEGARAWITGLRREQAPSRAGLEAVEPDPARPGVSKVSPLAAFTEADVDAYLARHRVPRHPLLAEGYRSIGCEPCTRAVAPGEDVRAGRWWWESPEHKECGLHVRGTP